MNQQNKLHYHEWLLVGTGLRRGIAGAMWRWVGVEAGLSGYALRGDFRLRKDQSTISTHGTGKGE